MAQIEILLDGLTFGEAVYRSGDVVNSDHPRLLALAGGELLLGQRVARFVREEAPEARPPLSIEPAEKPEKRLVNNKRGGRKR